MSDELPHVEGVTHRFVKAGPIRVHVAEAGEGEPVVLLHGWPQHWYCWRRVIGALAARHRVICPDLRGFGWSDAPASSYAKEELADDLLALLDALQLERVHMVGHDWGGLVGFLAALRAPERFSRLLALSIVHPWIRPRPSLKSLSAFVYQPLLATPLLGPLVQRHTPFYSLVFAVSGGERIWSAEEREAFASRFRDPARAEAASRVYRTLLTREARDLARGAYRERRLTVPTTLVVGRSDPVITPELLAGWEEHADEMRVEWVDGGHFLPEERPQEVIARVLAP